jgi:branched-chain amino acid transport system ATP-binding protein
MILEVNEIHAYYGLAHVLHGVSLRVSQGEVVALLGRNGAGKSTTLKAIMGIIPPKAGRVVFKGTDITGWPPHRVARLGVGYVPETRDIFSYLTAQENLLIAYNPRSRWTPETVTELFPKLAELRNRRGRNLSGGEQQMLAIARALLTGPELLLLDEPSQGLAPIVVESILEAVKRLKEQGLSMLLVEQNFDLAIELADRVYLIDHGQIVFEGAVRDLLSRPELAARYLGVTV